ncbi:MAG: hypothetical protein ACRCV3_03115 [Desulfovibrionaceae bacterium]
MRPHSVITISLILKDNGALPMEPIFNTEIHNEDSFLQGISFNTLENALHDLEVEYKKLQESCILLAKDFRNNNNNQDALLKLSALLRTITPLLRKAYTIQLEYSLQSTINDSTFTTMQVLSEEIGEGIVLEDWVLLSDTLEYELTTLIERWILTVKEMKQEVKEYYAHTK